jgi:hypothetical protein
MCLRQAQAAVAQQQEDNQARHAWLMYLSTGLSLQKMGRLDARHLQ